jgi:hypothetical protein
MMMGLIAHVLSPIRRAQRKKTRRFTDDIRRDEPLNISLDRPDQLIPFSMVWPKAAHLFWVGLFGGEITISLPLFRCAP